MKYKLKVPARINILGNPSDGLEGDFATISMAVDIYAGAFVEPADQIVLSFINRHHAPATSQFSPDDIPLSYGGPLDLMKGAVNRLYAFSPELRDKLTQQGGVKIELWTDVPRQSGLGGSSLLVILTLSALRAFYQLDARLHNDYILSEMTQRVEENELGITCGFADRYVPIFGGLGYLDYRGKLERAVIREQPFVTYERLDDWADQLRLVAVTSGIQRDSGDVHGRMRAYYLREHRQWQDEKGDPPPMVQFMTGAYQTAWQGKIALVEGDMDRFGELMNTNHRLVNDMMLHCGFEDGAGWANNMFIQAALDNGALGAKLTGAGSGGSVYALVRYGEEEKLIAAWKKAADKADLSTAHIYTPHVSRQGLVVEVE